MSVFVFAACSPETVGQNNRFDCRLAENACSEGYICEESEMGTFACVLSEGADGGYNKPDSTMLADSGLPDTDAAIGGDAALPDASEADAMVTDAALADAAPDAAPDALPVEQTCDDGVQNGDETDLDCGGACGPCADAAGCAGPQDCVSGVCGDDMRCAVPACDDGLQNGAESDVDCGGDCAACGDGAQCNDGQDCNIGVCGPDMQCAAPA